MKKIKDIKDIYWITEWFTDKEWIEYFLYDLYENKYSKWLNEFWLCDMPKGTYNRIPEEKQLDLTLDYLYPLLRDGKLKVKTKKLLKTKKDLKKELQNPLNDWWRQYFENSLQDSNWDWAWIYDTEYTKKESQKVIEDIKKKWLSIKDTREREFWDVLSIIYFIRKRMGLLKKRNWKQWITLRDFHSSDKQVREAGYRHEVTMDLLKEWWIDWPSEIKFLLPK